MPNFLRREWFTIALIAISLLLPMSLEQVLERPSMFFFDQMQRSRALENPPGDVSKDFVEDPLKDSLTDS